MSKDLVVFLDGGDAVARNEITNFLKSTGDAYWHWMDDLWFLNGSEFTAKSLQSQLRELPSIGTRTMLVFKLGGPMEYWGRADDKAWDWLKKAGHKVSS